MILTTEVPASFRVVARPSSSHSGLVTVLVSLYQNPGIRRLVHYLLENLA
jgi:hypothetical protein